MRWTDRTVALAVLGAAAGAFFAGRWSALPSPDACPELEAHDPTIAALDEPALERRLREVAVLPPSGTEKQIAALRAKGEGAAPARARCLRRAALAQAVVAQQQTRHSTPWAFGLDHPSAELSQVLLTQPLLSPWTAEQRRDVLAQIEESSVGRMARGDSPDVEHWRRRYYGLAIACLGADETLARLGATRPTDCPRLSPR